MENNGHDGWKLYLVQHPFGTFLGVARSIHAARVHFGLKAKITEADHATILKLRAEGNERVFLAF